jgi:glycosyltransferase involved in cell wall biosynthesis
LKKAHSISVLSLFSHALYASNTKSMGGAERRGYYWLQALQESGFKVSAVLAHQKGGPKSFQSELKGPWPLYAHPKYREDGHIVRAPKPSTGLWARFRDKVLVLFHRPLPNSTKQNKELSTAVYGQINADAYVAFGLTNAANELGRFCEAQGKLFIVSIAHDSDFDFLEIPEGRDAYDNKREFKLQTLNLADAIVAQTKHQEKLLEHLGVSANKVHRINNPIRVFSEKASEEPCFFLWIGRFDTNKNIEAVFTLARRCPEFEFMVVIGQAMTNEWEHRRPVELNNLSVVHMVSPSAMRALYRKAYCLVSTSFKEGFPNTFLEAWESGVPVASLHVNPDGILTSNELGFFSNGSLEELELFMRDMVNNPLHRKELGGKARRYVAEKHDLRLVSKKVKALAQSLL